MKKKKGLIWLLLAVVLLAGLPLFGCAKSASSKMIRTTDDLRTSKIGVQTGTIFDQEVVKFFPDATIEYYQSNFDLMAAIVAGKIDAYVCDEPFAQQMVRENPSFSILKKLGDDDYGFAFAKGSERAQVLCNQFNDFLRKCTEDGTIEELRGIWLGTDEARKDVDYSVLTGENGVLKMGISVTGAEPFTYLKENEYVGYEVDLAIRFCREYGYGLDVTDYNFDGLLAAVTTDKKVDFAASCISISDERNTILFSEPSYHGGIVVVVRKPVPVYKSFDELQGKRAGIVTGSVFDKVIRESIPDAKTQYLNSSADLSVALNSEKIDFFVMDEPVARYLIARNENQMILGRLRDDQYGIVFPKSRADLCEQMNIFLAKCKADGSLERLIDAWTGTDADRQTVDYENLPAENGTLTYALSTGIGAPYAYIQNGKYAGYEVALAVEFCRANGYGIKFFDTDFEGLFFALATCDFASSGISITEDRKEYYLFSDPICDGGVAVVVKTDLNYQTESEPFWQSLGNSIEKTFVHEERWKLFLSGIGTTLLVTVLSALFGTVFGFLGYLLYRKGRKPVVVLLDFLGDFFEKLPVVILLMILYYVIFGNVDISGIIVSVIGFTILFSFSVFGLFKSGVAAVDHGQTEAALALGYTERKAFLKMIFPQAVPHFMPGYKSSLIALIKDTSIVGYIAVQDLTKISDIVRSRTFEPFFPLIATAVIYFVLAILLIHIVKRVEIRTDSKQRKTARILKGVERK